MKTALCARSRTRRLFLRLFHDDAESIKHGQEYDIDTRVVRDMSIERVDMVRSFLPHGSGLLFLGVAWGGVRPWRGRRRWQRCLVLVLINLRRGLKDHALEERVVCEDVAMIGQEIIIHDKVEIVDVVALVCVCCDSNILCFVDCVRALAIRLS